MLQYSLLGHTVCTDAEDKRVVIRFSVHRVYRGVWLRYGSVSVHHSCMVALRYRNAVESIFVFDPFAKGSIPSFRVDLFYCSFLRVDLK